jgi:hypothetical protein
MFRCSTASQKFYASLARLDVKGARVYLGMIHSMPTFQQRLAVARKFLPDFGLAAYCGFGRIHPDRLPDILRDHRVALELAAREAMRAADARSALAVNPSRTDDS